MTKQTKIVAGGAATAVVLLLLTNWWITLLIMVGVPTAAYLMLDKSQRQRLRRVSRKELGR
ncbi:hypothetical protein [Streptomyces sp. NPDC060194]|uniref:hypothetical protein n=1 Tax=Streptomyces sp. NPDC060194 TaxID=3347069 RepID=UPI003668C20D